MGAEIFFSNFHFFELRDVFRTFQTSNSGYIFFFQKNSKFQNIRIENDLFINATALRASPAVTRLTVHRRLQVCYLAIERKRFLEICSLLLCNMNFPTCNSCVRSILTDSQPLGTCSLRLRSPTTFEKVKN